MTQAGLGSTPAVAVERDRPPVYVVLLVLALVANVFSGHSHLIGLPISLDRVLLPLALVLLWRDPRRPRAHWGVVGGLMAAFVVWILISMIWHGNLLTTSMWFALLDRVMGPFIMFLVGSLVFRSTERRDLLLKALTLVGLYLAVLAALEQWAPQLVVPSYIVNQEIGIHPGRSRGPFVDAEAMSMALATCGGAAVVLASRKLRRWTVLSGVIASLCMFGVVLTTTRSVWVGVAAGVVVALVLSPPLRRWIPAMLAAGVAGAAGILVMMPSLRETITERSTSTGPIYDRLASNAGALRVLEDLPLTGVGWRRFYPYGSEWARQSDSFPMNNAVIEVHNVVLSRAVELGIPAAIVFLLIIALGPLRSALPMGPVQGHPDLPAWRVLSGYVMTVWLVAGLFGPFGNPFPNYSVWLIAGVASYALICRPSGAPPQQRKVHARHRVDTRPSDIARRNE